MRLPGGPAYRSAAVVAGASLRRHSGSGYWRRPVVAAAWPGGSKRHGLEAARRSRVAVYPTYLLCGARSLQLRPRHDRAREQEAPRLLRIPRREAGRGREPGLARSTPVRGPDSPRRWGGASSTRGSPGSAPKRVRQEIARLRTAVLAAPEAGAGRREPTTSRPGWSTSSPEVSRRIAVRWPGPWQVGSIRRPYCRRDRCAWAFPGVWLPRSASAKSRGSAETVAADPEGRFAVTRAADDKRPAGVGRRRSRHHRPRRSRRVRRRGASELLGKTGGGADQRMLGQTNIEW